MATRKSRSGILSFPTSGVFICSDGTQVPWTAKRGDSATKTSARYTVSKGLVITLGRFDIMGPEAFLEMNREWVEKSARKMEAQHQEVLLSEKYLPVVLQFSGIGEYYQVEYVKTQSERITSKVVPAAAGEVLPTLRISGPVDDKSACHRALRNFTTKRAKERLPLQLAANASAHGLRYSECKVRSLTSRWGSCSSKGVITLATQCVFLPAELCRYVICHELAHLHHMDHSKDFHAFLKTMDPQEAAHQRECNKQLALIPAWMSASAGE